MASELAKRFREQLERDAPPLRSASTSCGSSTLNSRSRTEPTSGMRN